MYQKQLILPSYFKQPATQRPSNILDDHKGRTIIYNVEVYPLIPLTIKVQNPMAVIYAWADFSFKRILFNKEAHPALSFRTEKWDLNKK